MQKWFVKFRSENKSSKDGLRSAHSDFDEKALQILVNENPRLTTRELTNRNITFSTLIKIYKILNITELIYVTIHI